jgi:MFS superfamily sulfate permease-like transporter
MSCEIESMNLKDAAGTFSQLSGVLASFCVAFAILLLTPAVFPQGGGMPQDLVISLLLLLSIRLNFWLNREFAGKLRA